MRTADSSTAAVATAGIAGRDFSHRCQDRNQYYFEPDKPLRSEVLAHVWGAGDEPHHRYTMTGFLRRRGHPHLGPGLRRGQRRRTASFRTSHSGGVAFQGDEPITFNEAATVLNRVLAVEDVDLAGWYADREAVPSWAAQAVGNMEAVSVLAAGQPAAPPWERPSPGADAANAPPGTLLEGEPAGLFDWLL